MNSREHPFPSVRHAPRRIPRRSARSAALNRVPTAAVAALGVLCFALSCGVSQAAAPPALLARTISLDETGRLHATSKHEFTLQEQGSASGTFTGTIYVRLTLASTSRATAQIEITRSGGSISGSATAGYRKAREAATFSGTLTITGGTGSYRHVHGSGLSFDGTIQQSNDAITVRMSGRLSD
jgi:hypothetical protein